MDSRPNARIRAALLENNMKQWELADKVGISEYTLSKRMRKELPDEEQSRLISIICKNHKE